MRRRLLVPALALLCLALAFVQRTGNAAADTRLELSVDPGLFVERVASVWSATTDLGHIQSGQFLGYLAPMGPWFAAGDALGIPVWVTQRAWLALLLFLAAWGVARLMDALLGRRSAIASGAAALVFVLNPYTVQFTSRGTVALLAYAALPWLMLAVHQGLRENHGRGWRWPAIVGLLLAVSGGGVNAALIAFALVGPLALLVYELSVRGVDRNAAFSFTWRAGLAALLGCAWWALPLVLQSRYGTNFLLFTEQPRTIWGTTSLSELIRLLGFWGLYTGVGYGRLEPFMAVAGTYLFNPLVIVATFAVPLLAFVSLRTTRGWRYSPFFVLLAVLALLLMFAGFPEGTRLRSALVDLYNGLEVVQFLRTTYKAAPLLALSVACLAGAGALALARRLPPWALAALALLPVLAALPFFTGRAIDAQQAYGEVPGYWPDALEDADRAQAIGTRTMVVPGELFGWYRWGGVMDPVAPALSERPVAIREIVPYAGPRSSQLQVAVDDLIQQGRLVPDQLIPLLRLLDVGQVVVQRDSRRVRSGALSPAQTELALRGQTGLKLGVPYGKTRLHLPPAGRSGPALSLPDLSRRAVAGAPGPGSVRLLPRAGATVLEGDAEGVTQLAALGLLERTDALILAGDAEEDGRLHDLAAGGARIVLTDSARRRTFVAARLRANHGPTLGPDDPISPDSPTWNPFPERGTAGRTVALRTGLRRLFSPAQPGFEQFPQFRPYRALDGRADTSWLADENVPPDEWYLQLEPEQPLQVDSIAITPHATRHGRTLAVALSANGGPERRVELRRGRNEVRLDEPALRSLRIRMTEIAGDEDTRGAGGIAELEIPGLRVQERLRLPTALVERLRDLDLSRSTIDVALSRTTADFPYRAGADVGEPEDDSVLAMVDAEAGLERELLLPEARSFSLSGWASVDPSAPDQAIDRLAGSVPGWRLTSSSRFEGVPGRRASSAFDGDPATFWAGDLVPDQTAFLAWHAPQAVTVERLRLVRAPAPYAFPDRVRLVAPRRAPVTATVGSGGEVVLPRPLRTRSLRIEVERVSPRRGAAAARRLRAVGVAEVGVAGLHPPAPRRNGRFATRCGELELRARAGRATMRVTGMLTDLDAGRALRMAGCGNRSRLGLPDDPVRLSAPPGAVMRPDHLLLSSPAAAVAEPAGPPGRVAAVERDGAAAPQRALLRVEEPAWLVLTQSYNPGWRAWCKDRAGEEHELGRPVALEGYANGWPVEPGCTEARFAFAPQRLAGAGFAVSGVACLGMLALVLAGGWRSRRRAGRAPRALSAHDPEPPAAPPDLPLRAGLPAGLAIAAAVAIVGALLFALRMAPVVGLLALGLLRVGVTERRLVALACLAVGLMPVLYIAFPAEDKGGYSFQYATDHILPHWLGAIAVCCLAAAGAIGVWRLRTGSARRDEAGSS